MNTLKINFVLLFTLSSFFSCTEKNNVENIFIAQKDCYWQLNNDCAKTMNIYDRCYFVFKKDGISDQYDLDLRSGFELRKDVGSSDLITPIKKWELKKDSILSWEGIDYKIENFNKSLIILSYHKSEKKCKIMLIKVSGEK